jgi:hypothetical protein
LKGSVLRCRTRLTEAARNPKSFPTLPDLAEEAVRGSELVELKDRKGLYWAGHNKAKRPIAVNTNCREGKESIMALITGQLERRRVQLEARGPDGQTTMTAEAELA